jgi:hypothetical protein
MPSFHCLMSWSVQKSACCVCAAVLVPLSDRPRSLTWLKSSTYAWLERGFGGPGELRSAVEGQRANARQAKAENRRRQFNKPKGVDVGTDRYVIIGLALQKVRVDFVTSFPGGTVHAHGEGKRPSKPEVPIVGGTGLYAGATGSIEGQHLANGEKLNIYRLRVP